MSFDGNADRCIIKVVADTQADMLVANALAEKLHLSLGEHVASADAWQLLISAEQRTLVRPDGARLNIDFTQGKSAIRQAQASKDQSLVRALGLHKLSVTQRQVLHVVDATAGLGQDGWIIACQGCKVTMLEQSPLIASLLRHAIEQAALQPQLASIANNVSIINQRSQDYFANSDATSRPDIIYLDPMFPSKKKQAKVKKGMQFLQALLPPADNTGLLENALSAATSRVVVKRPTGAPTIDGTDRWQGQLTTVKTDAMRFDVYHTGLQA